jgi:hypothetical protein
MAKKKNNAQILVVLAVLAAVALYSGVFPGLTGAFTFGELQPFSVSAPYSSSIKAQLDVTFDKKAFLSNELIAGTMDARAVTVSGPVRSSICSYHNYHCDTQLFYNRYICIYANDTKVACYYIEPRYEPYGLPELGSIVPFTGTYLPYSFAFDLPSAIKTTGGDVELKFYVESMNWYCNFGWDSIGGTRYGPSCPTPYTAEAIASKFQTTDFSIVENHNYEYGTATAGASGPLDKQLLIVTSVYVEPSQCTDSSFVTYEQVFKSGTTIRVAPQNPNETGFRIPNPVFCHTAPVLKQYTDSNQVFEQSNTEYDSLTNGGYVTVPAGQQWVLFYRGAPVINDALVCQDNGGVWNATDNRCELPPTLWFVCNGIVTQQSECIVQATDYRCQNPAAQLHLNDDGTQTCILWLNPVPMCPSGSTMITVDGSPMCVFTPPTENQCPSGTTLQTVNGSPMCVFTPPTENQCPSGTTLQTVNGSPMCVFTPPLANQCPSGSQLQTGPNGSFCLYQPPVNNQCANPTATLTVMADGSYSCISTPTQSTANCPSGSTLKTSSTGVQFCEYQPVSVCADGSAPVNSQCTSRQPPIEGPVGTAGALDSGLLIAGIAVAGVLLWFFVVKRK